MSSSPTQTPLSPTPTQRDVPLPQNLRRQTATRNLVDDCFRTQMPDFIKKLSSLPKREGSSLVSLDISLTKSEWHILTRWLPLHCQQTPTYTETTVQTSTLFALPENEKIPRNAQTALKIENSIQKEGYTWCTTGYIFSSDTEPLMRILSLRRTDGNLESYSRLLSQVKSLYS